VVYEGIMNTERFLKWVSENLLPFLKKGDVLILDNARFHAPDKLNKLGREDN
jgi:3-phosphoglycerate kinase